jgi:hypothetical protein
MAIIGKSQTKPQDDGIPPMLDRRNGKGNGADVEALLARITTTEGDFHGS